MKASIKNVVLVMFSSLFLTLFALELFFRFIIPASQYPYVRFDETYKLMLFDPNLVKEGLFTIGKFAKQRGRWRVNNYGWNSSIDYAPYKEKPRVAVIGDSFVEAFQVDVDKNFAAVLREKLRGCYEVYSFGISGAPMSQYLNMYRYVAKVFDPEIVIVIVTHNDFDESIFNLRPDKNHFLTLYVQGDEIRERDPDPYTPNKLQRLARNSAIVRYLYTNLKVDALLRSKRQSEAEYNANIDVTEVQKDSEIIYKGMSYIFERFRVESGGRRIIFVIDGPREDIYAHRVDASNVMFLNAMLTELCKGNGFEFLDLTPSMAEAYAANGIKFNSEWDGHWNEYGHEFVAQQILDKFFDQRCKVTSSRME